MNLKIVLRDISAKTEKGNIKIGIYVKGCDRVFIPTPYFIEPDLFDAENEIIKRVVDLAAKWNAEILAQKSRYESYYKELGDSVTGATPQTLKKLFITYDNIRQKSGKPVRSVSDFIGVADKLIYDLKNEDAPEGQSREGYASTFEGTRNLLVEFFKSETIFFQSVDSYALVELKKYFLKNRGKEVTFNKHLRNIKRIFNIAIGQKLISRDLYPFDAISIPSDYEAEIRSLDVDVIRKFYGKTGVGRDMFFLSFFLCGMNMKDIFYMPYFEGNIDIKRLKTARTARKVRLKLKFQPEAIEIISRYSDKDKQRLIKTIYSDHRVFTHLVDDDIKKLCKELVESGSKSKIDFSFTYARHSWATIAGQLRISDSVIDKAQMRSVTGKMIEKYREYDYSQVDEANRKVIDYVLCNIS